MPDQLIAGLKRFRRESFPRFREHYEKLVAEGQHPSTLFIGCSDFEEGAVHLLDVTSGRFAAIPD